MRPSSEPGDEASAAVDRRHLALVFVATVAVAMLAIDARATYGARVTADEPQYLLTAISLAEDLDLDIADELEAERFRPFHELDLNPQTLDLNDNGQRLSPHDPLLPAILAPAVAIGGWAGAKIALALLTAVTAALTAWTANRRLGAGATTTTVVTTGFFVTPPLTAYGSQIYPEMPAAFAVMAGVAALLRPRPSAVSSSIAALAVIALPWLSVKYVPVAAILAVALLLGLLTERNAMHGTRSSGLAPASLVDVGLVRGGFTRAGFARAGFARAGFLGVGLAGAGLIYLLVHRRIYGGWTVYAAGDHFVGGEFEVVGTDPDYPGRTRRLIGLLVDRRFGLIPWAPAYLLTVPALVARLRRPGSGRILLPAIVATGWAVATWVALTMHGWWWPGRQLVVILPVVVMVSSQFIHGLDPDRRRRVLLAVAAASTLSLVNWLWLVAEASTGRRTLIVDFFETSSPLYRIWSPLFPDHTVNTSGDAIRTGLWIVGLGAIATFGWRWSGTDQLRSKQLDELRVRRPDQIDLPQPEPGAGRCSHQV